jgi:hypothetical protein
MSPIRVAAAVGGHGAGLAIRSAGRRELNHLVLAQADAAHPQAALRCAAARPTIGGAAPARGLAPFLEGLAAVLAQAAGTTRFLELAFDARRPALKLSGASVAVGLAPRMAVALSLPSRIDQRGHAEGSQRATTQDPERAAPWQTAPRQRSRELVKVLPVHDVSYGEMATRPGAGRDQRSGIRPSRSH